MRLQRKLAMTLLLAAFLAGCSRDDAQAQPPPSPAPTKTVLHSRLAGSWYPANADALKKQLKAYADNAEAPRHKHVRALLLPHAGYRFSGQTAAHAVKQIAGRKYSRVIVAGPTHRVAMRNRISVPAVTHYSTPLGGVELDRQVLLKLLAEDFCRSIPQAHATEHSVQIQLPLLQHALDGFKLVPIVVGQLDAATAGKVAAAIRPFADDDTLLVFSSDFTHYGPNFNYTPFRDNIPENLKKLDLGAFSEIEKKDLNGFYGYIAKHKATICGRHAIGVLLALMPEDAKVHRLHYDTSGRILDDFKNSVSYISAAVTWTSRLQEDPLTAEEKQVLLKLARQTLEYRFREGKSPDLDDLNVKLTPTLKQKTGVFVTLHKNKKLRGCIGFISPDHPTAEGVVANALNAAFRDPRFPAVKAAELPQLHIEVSVLTPPRPVNSHEDIVIGRHGIILKQGFRRAVFLPQVAPEQGWDLETTLAHLARKAGLPKDGWRKGAKFEVFEAIVFAEAEE